MTKDWDNVWTAIQDQYVRQNKPLHEVQRILEQEHKFKASTRAYRAQLLGRGITKYRKRRRSTKTTMKRKTSTSPFSSACASDTTSTNGNKSPRPPQSPPYGPDSEGCSPLASPLSVASLASHHHLFDESMFGAAERLALGANPAFAARAKGAKDCGRMPVQVKLEPEQDARNTTAAPPFFDDEGQLHSPLGSSGLSSPTTAALEQYFNPHNNHHHHHQHHQGSAAPAARHGYLTQPQFLYNNDPPYLPATVAPRPYHVAMWQGCGGSGDGQFREQFFQPGRLSMSG